VREMLGELKEELAPRWTKTVQAFTIVGVIALVVGVVLIVIYGMLVGPFMIAAGGGLTLMAVILHLTEEDKPDS